MEKASLSILGSTKRVSWQDIVPALPLCRLSAVLAVTGMSRLIKAVAATARKMIKHFIRCLCVLVRATARKMIKHFIRCLCVLVRAAKVGKWGEALG